MRLKVLIAVHLVIGVCQVAEHFIPLDVRFAPLLWAIISVLVAQLMLLSFWVGMGTSTGIPRLGGMVLGSAYLATWWTVPQLSSYPFDELLLIHLPVTFGAFFMVVVVLAGIFLGIRRWKAELSRDTDAVALPPRTPFQYSLLNLLVIVSVVAIVLALGRSIRLLSDDDSDWRPVLKNVFLVIACFVNLLGAVWAVLNVGPVGLRTFLVFLMAAILGASVSSTTSFDTLIGWLQLLYHPVITIVPTAIVVVSLLVVRSCGYRLVPKNINERV
ncbi:MAG: hypothetical protein HY000_05950 [Planctomycetes bacterium]|nr:hypothetical protein [Planctomycetota bacterium]